MGRAASGTVSASTGSSLRRGARPRVGEATRADIPALTALLETVARRTYAPAHAGAYLDRWLAQHCTDAYYRYRVGRSGYHVLCAKDPAGNVLGVGVLRQRGARADLSGMYVMTPGCGVGGELLDALRRRASELGCEQVRASVWRTNKPAREFFAHRGVDRRNGGYRESTVGVMVDHYEGPLPGAAQVRNVMNSSDIRARSGR